MELSSTDKIILHTLFSPQEKQSLYQVMCAVRKIGGHHITEKTQHIQEVMSITGISEADKVQSRKLTQPQMTTTIKCMSTTKKLYLAKFVSMTALIGGASEKELMFLNWFFNEANISPDF